MKLSISSQKGVKIANGMMGLFFEDINYAADGGLYAELLENRSFEFVDCYGDKGDYYVKPDYGYGWAGVPAKGEAEDKMPELSYVTGSPLNRVNPHYLRFTAYAEGQGFSNQAYSGLYLKKGLEYRVSFYARTAFFYDGDLTVSVEKDGKCFAKKEIAVVHSKKDSWQKWNRYETVLTTEEDTEGALFVIRLSKPGTMEFDFVSMMPGDAVEGVFRKDLFEMLQGLHPGFIRFPGGCIIEGNTLENRYRWKESVGKPEGRRVNFNRWALHETKKENGWHTKFSHYNQSLGLGYFEYFLLCEKIGAKPLPVLNVGLACQYQSYEFVERNSPEFDEFIQDALDLIEFATGDATTGWGKVRADMGHATPFDLTMVGIGNEQWQTEEIDFYERYEAFEKAIHAKYPEMRLIGSAGPDITSDHYREAWEFYKKHADNPMFSYAVDEHYYVRPDWFYEHTDFYDEYPRNVKVFSGEYAAHPASGHTIYDVNTLGSAIAEAAFMTGIERNADVVVLASYAPLFARVGYTQWAPDLIWFDETRAYKTPSYYVQKMYGENMGTVTIPMDGQEKLLAKEKIYGNVSFDETSEELIIKVVNHNLEEKKLELDLANEYQVKQEALVQWISGNEEDYNSVEEADKVKLNKKALPDLSSLQLPAMSFSVIRIPVKKG